MADAPARPKTVPPKAVWSADDGEWELGAKNVRGERQGTFKFWRRDGTLCNECVFKDGRPHGTFKRFHNNGQVSQEGQFVDGQLHGRRAWFACDEATDEETIAEGMSDKVRRSEMDYDKGRVVAVRHFDAAGHRILPTGESCPERPPMIPDEAEYQPEVGWVLATLDLQGRRNGPWQRWHDSGHVAETTEFVHNLRHGPTVLYHPTGQKAEEGRFEQGEREGLWRSWDEAGALVREVTWRSGSRHGPAVDRSVAGQYRDPSISVERGAFDDDHACGPWSLQDAQGKTTVRRDLGSRADEERLLASAVLSNETKSFDLWHLLAEECVEGKRPGEAVLAAARAAACSGSVKGVMDLLAELSLPRASAHALEVAETVAATDAPISVLLNVILRGGAPAPLLRAVAVRLDQQGRCRAALDFVNTAILFEPLESAYLFTRALVLMSLGLPAQALLDARAREKDKADEARFLCAYAQALYPRFDFWPSRERPQSTFEDLPQGPAQPPAAVRVVFLKYVTRLSILREELLAWVKPGVDVDWLPPDLSRHLPKGPVKLETNTFEVEGEDGEASQIAVDERMRVNGLGLPELLRLARADWAALTWLCWASGLQEIALPKALVAPADFGQAAGMAVQRLWRARDRRVTGGVVARREKAPSFEWEGVDIDALHAGLLSMPEAEYAEMAAMFRWLTDAHNRSPWQDNLRNS
jgi:antitoxin component YwqK of YwqJK toxin-antitoxin module